MEPTTKSTVIKDKVEGFYKDTIEEAKKSEYVKKAGNFYTVITHIFEHIIFRTILFSND